MATVAKNPGAEQAGGASGASGLQYMTGLGNEHETQALPGTLPVGQNSPQKVAHGLVSELHTGTTFSAPRSFNRRSYVFRIRPSVITGKFAPYSQPLFATPDFGQPNPNHYSWRPFASQKADCDFVDGIATIAGTGSPHSQSGMAMHVFSATRSMKDRVLSNADGEMLIVPRVGDLRIHTEYGVIETEFGDVVVIPRGVKFRVELLSANASGLIAENYGLPLRLPELGLIGSNGLANVADFQIPVAAYEKRETPTEHVYKFAGKLWTAQLPHSPLDVVAWRGSLYPYKYNLHRFVGMGAVNVDHPDPSIFCFLTSPSDPIIGPNLDVMAITPRWNIGDHSFRPPGFHLNNVCEFIFAMQGYAGLDDGSITMTNNFTPHGPETETVAVAREMPDDPMRLDEQLFLLFETRFPLQVTPFAENAAELMGDDYTSRWDDFTPYFDK
ncbi:homogentisate 1,2-dioxygenase [Croceicoccus sediminis]|uniref:homogentisate 1,2-dioxygenase n=1 Tax=Croceicoccus sediminis TaxID=2571150 RepID=UPI0011821E58|nr:homogentisate 1,2-dioxygenase [Croceicoccus sediminis]